MSDNVPMTLGEARDLFERNVGADHIRYEQFVRKHYANHGLTYVALGMAGEAGEVADQHKKEEFHGIPRDIPKMNLEVGDVLFHIYAYCIETNQDIETIMEANMEKLRKRYPNGFVLGGGIR